MIPDSFDGIPLGFLFLFTCLLSWLALECGYRLGLWRQARAIEQETSINTMVGSTLGLLAFLLAFTFSLAEARYDVKRQAILDEANAIGTTYLRTRLLPEPQQSEIASLLREYVVVRIQGMKSGQWREAVQRSEEIQTNIWSKAVDASKSKESNSVMTSLFLQSLNETIDFHAVRIQAGGRSRIPFTIWLGLFALAFLAMASVGYQSGLCKARRSLATVGLILAFAGVLFLIVDLDRAQEGFIRVSQQPLLDVQKSMAGIERS